MKNLIKVLIISLFLSFSRAHIDPKGSSEPQGNKPVSTIQVTGSASASVKPDEVALSFIISSLAKTASEALSANNEILNKAFSVLRANNMTNEELGTSDFSIGPTYETIYYNNGSYGSVFKGYTVSTTLKILTKKTEMAGSLVDAVVSQGVKQVSSINFQISKEVRKNVEDQLLIEAVKNAKMKADLALETLSAHVKGLVSMDLDNTKSVSQYREKAVAFAYDAVATNTKVYAASQDVNVNINAVFEVGQGVELTSVFP